MLKIYTDGACKNNGEPNAKASWAFVVLQNQRVVHNESGLVEGKQSNNTGELMAIKFALLHAIEKECESVVIFSDSEYAIDSLTKWNIEKKIKGKQKKNYDLIKEIQQIIEQIDVDFEWVRGHNEDWYNDMADQLANGLLYERD